MPTLEIRRARDGTEVFKCKVRLKGAPCVSKTFRRKTDARQWGRTIEAQIRDGRLPVAQRAAKMTLADAIARYEREILPRKPDTAPFQRRQLAWWKEQLGDRKLVEITRPVVAEARSRLLAGHGRHGRSRGSSTANRYTAVLSHLFSIAQREWEVVRTNPVAQLGKLKEPRGRQRRLNQDEIKRLLAACAQSSQPLLRDAVVLTLATGMRRSEVLWLRRRDVDLENRMVVITDSKNEDPRAVPITGHALAVMKKRIEATKDASDLLFPGRKAGRPFDIRKPWYAALAEAKINDFRFHDLRHTAGSAFAEAGMSEFLLGKVLGHRTPAMTRRYVHLNTSVLREGVEATSKRLFAHVDHTAT